MILFALIAHHTPTIKQCYGNLWINMGFSMDQYLSFWETIYPLRRTQASSLNTVTVMFIFPEWPHQGASSQNSVFLDILTPDDGTTTLSRNVGNWLPGGVASYPRRTETTATPVQKPKNLQIQPFFTICQRVCEPHLSSITIMIIGWTVDQICMCQSLECWVLLCFQTFFLCPFAMIYLTILLPPCV